MNIYNLLFHIKQKAHRCRDFFIILFYYIFTFSFIKKIKYNPKDINSILIVKNEGLGDGIIISKLIYSLQKYFGKNTKIILLCKQELFPFYTINFKDLKLITNPYAVDSADILIGLSQNYIEYLYTKLKPKIFLSRCMFYNDHLNLVRKTPFPNQFKSAEFFHCDQILNTLNVPIMNLLPDISENIIYDYQNIAIINLVAAKKARYIPEKLSKEIINYFTKNYFVYLTYYSNEELQYIKSICAQNKNLKYLKIDLNTITSTIKSAKIIITTDTGFAHLCAFYNKKQIVIFGPGDIHMWKPSSLNTKIIYYPFCHGCERQRNKILCGHDCMLKITLKNILSKLG